MGQHRVEIVRYTRDQGRECWATDDGSIVLLRDAGADTWRAVVDRYEVVDAERLNGASAFEPQDIQEATMVGVSAQGLARNLALQEQIHLLFIA